MGLTNDAEAELTTQFDMEKVKLALLIALKDRNVHTKPSAGDALLRFCDKQQDIWAGQLCERYKLLVWLGSYMILAAAYGVSAQTWIDPATSLLLPWSTKGIQVIAKAAKMLATAGCSGLCIRAALHLYPLTADPLPSMVQQSYRLLDEAFPGVKRLRIANLIFVLAVTAALVKKMWA